MTLQALLFGANSEAYYHFIINMATSFEIFFCLYFYALPYKKRNHFALRFLGGLALLVILIFCSSFVRAHYYGYFAEIITTFSFYLYYFLLLSTAYSERASELLLCLCAGVATQTIVGRLFEFLYILCGKDPYKTLSLLPDGFLPQWLDWAVYYVLHLCLIYLVSRIFCRNKVYSYNKQLSKLIVIFSASITVITILLSAYARPLEPENQQLAFVIRVFSILYALLVVTLRTGILEHSRMSEELRITEELLCSEKKQFEDVKADMEIINMKCHDIRHQLDQYSGKLTAEELHELKSAIRIYDASLKTGSDILDMVLYKKKPYMDEKNIQISCIADGKCLRFISQSHLYSLLNNALNNAIEALDNLQAQEMRIISLNIHEEKGLVGIHMTNYFNQECVIRDGVPQTTAISDRQHHGYGTKSMRYIVQQYGGTISFNTEGNIFYLDILIPINEMSGQ